MILNKWFMILCHFMKMVSLGARQSLWLHSIHITITQSHQNASRFSVQNVESMCRSMGTDIQSFPPSTRVLMQAMQQAVTKVSGYSGPQIGTSSVCDKGYAIGYGDFSGLKTC